MVFIIGFLILTNYKYRFYKLIMIIINKLIEMVYYKLKESQLMYQL